MKSRISLRMRLAFGLTTAMVVVWLLAMVASAFTLRHEVEELSESLLALTAERLLPLALDSQLTQEALGPEAEGAEQAHLVSPVAVGEDSFVWVLRRVADGSVAMQTSRIDSDLLSAPIAEGQSQTEHFEVYTHLSPDGAYAIQVGETRDGRNEALVETMQALAAPLLLLVLPFSIFFVLWLSRRALRPVEALSNEVAGRDARDLSPLEAVALPAELSPIHDAVDALLERLRRALEAERSFASNAAHELRTPIAATMAQTQRLVAEAPEGGLRQRAQKIERELARIAQMSEKLLELARADGGGVISGQRRDLVPVMRLVLADLVDGSEGWEISLPDSLPSYLDRDACGMVLRNLVENAKKHGDPSAPISVAVTADGVISVTNGGAVIAPESLAQLTERFERGGAQTEGSGLGLAIVAAVTQSAGVGFTLLSPAPDRADGFCARVDLRPLL